MKSKAGKALIVSVYSLALYYLLNSALKYYIGANNTKGFSSTVIMIISGVVTIPFLLYPYFFTSKPKGGGTATKWECALWIILTMVLGLVLNVVIKRIPSLIQDDSYQKSFSSITEGGLLYTMILTCIVAPILEELLFRGIIFAQFKDAFGTVVGVIVSAFIFGVMHFNLAQGIYAFIMGVVFAIMLNRTKKLFFPILAHSLCNLAVLLMTNFL